MLDASLTAFILPLQLDFVSTCFVIVPAAAANWFVLYYQVDQFPIGNKMVLIYYYRSPGHRNLRFLQVRHPRRE